MSRLGTVQFRGQFLDYSWILLVLSLSYLVLHFASSNAEGFGIPANALPKMQIAQLVTPLLLLGFMVWAGANFELGLRFNHLGDFSDLENTGTKLHAGLDYGYWLGLLGSTALVAATALKIPKSRQFVAGIVGAVGLALIVAYVHNWPSKVISASPVASASDTAPSSGSSASSSGASTPAENGLAPFDSSPYVVLDSVLGKLRSKNYEDSRYSDSVEIRLRFKNRTDKTITGLRGRVEVLDAFGTSVFGFNFRDDDKILPKASEGSGGYSFDHNQFENDDPYSKMSPLISADTAKYRVIIDRVAFADGTIVPAE